MSLSTNFFRSVAPGLVLLLLVACSPPTESAGAPEIGDDRVFGADEQLPSTSPATTEAPTPASTRAPLTALTEPFTCPEQTVAPLNGRELRAALRKAKPGDVIYLEPGIYPGRFKITSQGTARRPIYLCGPTDAVLDGRAQNRGYVLHLDGAVHWRLSGFTVRNGLKGIMVDTGKRNVLQNLKVEETGNEAVHLRKNSTDNVVQGLEIRKTGKVKPEFGEGLYVGSAESNWCDITACAPDRSDRNKLLGNKMSLTTAEAIDVKEGTSNGMIAGNQFDGSGLTGTSDSWVDIKGNGWRIRQNRGQFTPKDGYQTHVILPGWGDKNVFSDNTAALNGGTGVGYYIHKKLKNRIACDNTITGGRMSNVACQG
jgi:hypothetical protein